MKRIILTAALTFALMASAQPNVKVKSMSRVVMPEGTYVGNHSISPDGKFVVFSDGQSIKRLDIATHKVTPIAKAESAYNLRVSPDGNQVVYYEPEFNDNLRYVSLKSAPTSGGSPTTVIPASRNLNIGVSLTSSTVNAVEGGRHLAKRVSNTAGSTSSQPVVSISYGHLVVTRDGVSREIDPQGPGSYLWPSLSPDGTRIVYWSCGDGCFVCDLDGKNVKPLGRLHAPVWAGDDLIIGMDDKDNGRVVTASRLRASDLRGNKIDLTGDEVIAMYPSAAGDGSKVTFSAGNAIYIISLEKR